MMRFVYFTLNKTHKEIDVIITYACFGIKLVEISPAGAFLRRFFMGGVNMKNSNLPDLNVTWTLKEVIIKPIL